MCNSVLKKNNKTFHPDNTIQSKRIWWNWSRGHSFALKSSNGRGWPQNKLMLKNSPN